MLLRRKTLVLILALVLTLGTISTIYGGTEDKSPSEPLAKPAVLDPPDGYITDANGYMAYSTGGDLSIGFQGFFEDRWVRLGNVFPAIRYDGNVYRASTINDQTPFLVTTQPRFSDDGKFISLNYVLSLKDTTSPLEPVPYILDFAIYGYPAVISPDDLATTMTDDNRGFVIASSGVLDSNGSSAMFSILFGDPLTGGDPSGIWVGPSNLHTNTTMFQNQPMNLPDGVTPNFSAFWLEQSVSYATIPLIFGGEIQMMGTGSVPPPKPEPEPLTPPEPKKEIVPKDPGTTTPIATSTTPKTGDESVALWAVLLMLTGAATAVGLWNRKPS